MNQEFIYDSKVSDYILSQLSAEDKAIFPCDVRMVNWTLCLHSFQFGVRRYFLKEDCLSPPHDSGFKQLLAKNQIGIAHDIRLASGTYSALKVKDLRFFVPKVLSNEHY
jgi:hypothetical protein